MKPSVLLLSIVLAPALLAGCSLGSDDAGGGNDLDDRSATMACLQDAGVSTRDWWAGRTTRRSSSATAPTAPRIKFFLTAGEAEAEQFQGRGEGAEQIGGTLLYVGDGSDDQLEPVEKCLADL